MRPEAAAMTTTTKAPPATLDQRVLDATIGALELFGIYLGTRLGLYDALRTSAGSTARDLADAAGIAPRCAREWLQQQAVAGVLIVDDVTAGADARRYSLPEAHVGSDIDSSLLRAVQYLTGVPMRECTPVRSGTGGWVDHVVTPCPVTSTGSA
jgi:hypothetical protein